MLIIKHHKTGFSRESGFSLIELMLAMLIGLIIMGGVMQMFITTRDTQRTSEDQMQLIADARFVMQTIAFDLRHAGIWGGTNETILIRCRKNDGICPADQVLGPATSDCLATNDWYIDLDFPVVASNDSNLFSGTCATEGYQLGTDMLGLHYADPISVATSQLAANVTYVRSNFRDGQVFVSAATDPKYPASTGLYKWIDVPLDSVTKNYPLKSRVYYVSNYTDVVGDGMPSLRRVELSAGPAMKDSVLIPGVEDFQVEFGVDTTGDYQVNIYMDADNVAVGGTNGISYWNTGDVIAVKIWLLMRAENADRNGVGGDQTFILAGNNSVTYTDDVRRFLMTGVVRLRNTSRIDLRCAGC